jgi:outer membrane lipoprotein
VTFTGRIEGYEKRKVEGYVYDFPRVSADVVYLWPKRERVDVVTRPSPWPWAWNW